MQEEKPKLPSWLTHVATIIVVLVALIVVVVGGVVTIAGNQTFQEYLDALWKVGGAGGLLAVGRGIYSLRER